MALEEVPERQLMLQETNCYCRRSEQLPVYIGYFSIEDASL